MHNLIDSLGKREKPRPGEAIPLEGFIACSRFVLERESARLGAGAAFRRVVYNGVEVAAFPNRWQDEAAVRRARQPYRLSQEPTVLFAGKLRESKGVQVLLAAMERVWQSLPRRPWSWPGARNTARGAPCGRPRFSRSCAGRWPGPPGRVVLTGFLPYPEMPRAYLLGDVFVGPSQVEEGLGLVFLEAAAAGLPSSPPPGAAFPRWCKTGATACCLSGKTTPGSWRRILQLLRDRELSQRLGRQGREWVSSHFSWEQPPTAWSRSMLKSRAGIRRRGLTLPKDPKKPKNQKYSDPGPLTFKQLNLEL